MHVPIPLFEAGAGGGGGVAVERARLFACKFRITGIAKVSLVTLMYSRSASAKYAWCHSR